MKLFSALFLVLALAGTAFADITVSGEGSVSVVPDQAHVIVGVVTEGQTPGDCLAANNKAVSALVLLLDETKIEQKDIRTTSFNVEAQYVYDQKTSQNVQKGYVVVNQVSVCVRNLPILPQLLSDLVKVGANRIGGVSYSSSHLEAYQDAARVLAVKDATKKAKLYADVAGVKVGKVLDISETSSYRIPPTYAARAMAAPGADRSPTPVSAGEMTVTSGVSVKYAIE
jgi:hypothetical protein